MLVKRVLNPAKKKNVKGTVFHLLFLGLDAVLYDSLWDSPIIYGNKGLVRSAITDPRKLSDLLPIDVNEITLYVYKIQDSGQLKQMGPPITGKPPDLTIPNY